MADAGPVEAEGAELIHAVSRFEENGTSAVVAVRLEGTASRPAQHKEGLCSKSSFDAELKRHIDVRRVRANDPALRKIDWSDQGLANSQVNAKHGGRALEKNLVEALKNNTYVTCVDIHNNSKITHTTTNELRVRDSYPPCAAPRLRHSTRNCTLLTVRPGRTEADFATRPKEGGCLRPGRAGRPRDEPEEAKKAGPRRQQREEPGEPQVGLREPPICKFERARCALWTAPYSNRVPLCLVPYARSSIC